MNAKSLVKRLRKAKEKKDNPVPIRTVEEISDRGMELLQEYNQVKREIKYLKQIEFLSIQQETRLNSLILRRLILDAQIMLIHWILRGE